MKLVLGIVSLALATLAPAACTPARAEEPAELRLGAGRHVYRWVSGWGALPDGKQLGNTHGCIVHDSQGRIYVNTDTEDAVVVFDASGKRLAGWGKELRGGLHGMVLAREGEQEFLYLAHHTRRVALKTTLAGEVLWTLGWPEASGKYEKAEQFSPTSIAVAPDGSIFVADGYGLSWIHKYDKERRYLKSFGGPGSAPGQLRSPHGILLDTRVTPPVLLVADRENNRLQSFDLEGQHLGIVQGMLRRPSNLRIAGQDLVIADLAGRVTILDGKNELVTHLGDQPDESLRAVNGVPPEKWKDGQFLAPHCADWDAQGNLYVVDWNATGRVSKLERVGR